MKFTGRPIQLTGETSPGPITQALILRYPLAPAVASSGSLSNTHLLTREWLGSS